MRAFGGRAQARRGHFLVIFAVFSAVFEVQRAKHSSLLL